MTFLKRKYFKYKNKYNLKGGATAGTFLVEFLLHLVL